MCPVRRELPFTRCGRVRRASRTRLIVSLQGKDGQLADRGRFLMSVVIERGAEEGWASPGIPDTFDRCEDEIGGVRWSDAGLRRSSSERRCAKAYARRIKLGS